MKIFLCGGGSGERAGEAMKTFGEIIDKKKPLLYIPLAMNEERYPECLVWIKSEMKLIGIKNIHMIVNPKELINVNYNDYCAIFLGGGNTYKLLNDIKSSGAFNKIKEYIENDGIVFGGSAGAIIFGKNIDTANMKMITK
ncbi:MAG: Type 1 glutamine amidotransferase-like domain-containing protein [Bacilli bacterium]|nr:Type 1 glutamine amidotransferase-like domain-containing protein [Bacilli bacterium]